MTYTDRRQTRGNSSRGKNGASSSCVLHTASAPHVPPSATPPSQYIVTLQASAGLMPTEARGNYFPEPPYLRETKDLSQPATRVDTTCWQLFRPDINTAHFYLFFVAEVMSNYLTTDGLKKILYFRRPPFGQRPVAFATSATWLIRHCSMQAVA